MSSGALPPGWIRTTLGEIGRYLNGRAFKTDEWSTRGRMIVRIQDLTGSGDSPNYFEGSVEPRYEVHPGDFLISWAATLGAYIWRGPAAVLNQHIFKVESYIDKTFHFYLVTHILDDLRRQAHGSGMVHITKGKFDSAPVLLPPLAEQRRIVAALEEHLSDLDAAVAGLERARLNHRRYRTAVLRAAVDGSLVDHAERQQRGPDAWSPNVPSHWRFDTVENLAELVEYGSSAKTREAPNGVPVLRMGNIVDGELSWDALKYLPSSHDAFPALLLSPGDVLFNRTNSPELVGKTAVYEATRPQASFASYLLRVRLRAGLSPRFFSAYINSTYGRAWIASVVSQQVGQANVNGTKLRALAVPVPPEDEQERIVAEMQARLDAARHVMLDVDVQLARAARLRQSILKRAFEGKLVPQDPSDEPASALLVREHDLSNHTSAAPPRVRRARATASRGRN